MYGCAQNVSDVKAVGPPQLGLEPTPHGLMTFLSVMIVGNLWIKVSQKHALSNCLSILETAYFTFKQNKETL